MNQPIPQHLAPYLWYASHQAWLVMSYGVSRHDPAGAMPARADLRDADLADANFHGTDLAGADLAGANLCGTDLCGTDLARELRGRR